MDRAYRFGQTRDVAVYRLLGAGSIEELIYARQVYKQQQMQVGYNASLQTRSAFLRTWWTTSLTSAISDTSRASKETSTSRGSCSGSRTSSSCTSIHWRRRWRYVSREGMISAPMMLTGRQIERAHVSDLDWAFAYMGGKNGAAKRPQAKAKKAGVHWVYEEEAKTGKDYVCVYQICSMRRARAHIP